MSFDLERAFEYENGYFATAPINRISKFVTHLELFKQTSGLAGDIVECGVFKGNSLMHWIKFRALLEHSFSRRIFAFDTFGAFPPSSHSLDIKERDAFIRKAGGVSESRESILNRLQSMGLNQNLELIEGDMADTVPEFIKKNEALKISLLHIDVDLYAPTRLALECFFPKVVRGGVIILDDYGAMPGANKAVDEFFLSSVTRIKKLPFSHAISFVEKE